MKAKKILSSMLCFVLLLCNTSVMAASTGENVRKTAQGKVLMEKYDNVIIDNTNWFYPTEYNGQQHYKLSSFFAPRWGSHHSAIDIECPDNTIICAAKSGVVVGISGTCKGIKGCCNNKTGNYVVVYHGKLANGKKVFTIYKHIAYGTCFYNIGDEVLQGAPLVKSGHSGHNDNGSCYAQHLDFSIALENFYNASAKSSKYMNCNPLSSQMNGNPFIDNSNSTDQSTSGDGVQYVFTTHTPGVDCKEYATINNGNKKLLGACTTCQTEFDWLSHVDIIQGKATLNNANKNYKVTLYKKPYKDAEKINTQNKVLKEFPVIGTVKNAYGNEWYAVDYQDNDGKVNWTGYIYSQTLTDNYKVTINNESNVEKKYSSAVIDKEHSHNYNYNNGQCYCGAVKATSQQTNAASTLKINLTKYPVQHTQGNNFGLRGTISSNYKIKKIYGYIKQNGNVIQSTEDSPNTKSVDVRDKNLNNNLVFETLGTGNYTLEVYAVDASGRGITVTKNFTVVGQTVKAESTLSINLDKYPVTLNAGSGFGLRGSITSNYNIALVKGYVINSSGQTVLSSKDTPNSTSMDIRYANLNDDLVFNNLGAGNYTMKVVATDNSGRTVEVSKAFSVISNTSSNNSTLAINLQKYPVTLDVGSSYGLRGTITSNYNISVVRGYVINSNGQTVLSSKDTPNSTYMDIKPAHLNADLIFNNLSAGNYTMKVVAVDASGRTVEATKNFTVKAKDVYVDNSPNGNGVTGTVAIPSSWENLSIRSGPSTNYQIVGSMNNGAKCTVYPNKTSNGWYYVNYNGIWGYASGNQINLNNSSNANTRTGIVNIPSSWTDLSIRTGPSTNYQIVGGMPHGARCTVYPVKASNGWYYVNYNGVSGYAAGNRINLQ